MNRGLALAALGDLGEQAQCATPVLLQTLKRNDPYTRSAIIAALRKIHVEQRSLAAMMLELGFQRRYADIVEIARPCGQQDGDMIRLLAGCLNASDPAIRRMAMSLLERSGTATAPVLNAVLRAMKDSDSEVRWLATRSVEANATNNPKIVEALTAALGDENEMVRTVARRTLQKIATSAASHGRTRE